MTDRNPGDVAFAPGWFLRDVRRADARVAYWEQMERRRMGMPDRKERLMPDWVAAGGRSWLRLKVER